MAWLAIPTYRTLRAHPANMAPQTFHLFPDLPKELRDEIWRLCLPHRVAELDLPPRKWVHEPVSPPNGQQRRRPCLLGPTSMTNSAPPLISRVCHESRTLALKTGHLRTEEGRRYQDARGITESFWLDLSRDVLHLHWSPFSTFGEDTMKDSIAPLEHLLSVAPPTSTGAALSIDVDLLDTIEAPRRRDIMRLLEQRPRWSICGAIVVIHVADEAAAIDSGLWGVLGEERVVLVDCFDADRLDKFRRFWQEHGSKRYREAKHFFQGMVRGGVPMIHYVERPEQFLLDLQIRWLHDSFPLGPETPAVRQLKREVWRTKPQDFDDRDDDPRFLDYEDLPGRPFARQLWSPNPQHPWVKEVLSRMPEFGPTIMFRLCTKNCSPSA